MNASPQGRGRSWRDSRWGTVVVAILAAASAILLYGQLGPQVNAPTAAIQDFDAGDGVGSTSKGRGRITHSPTIMRDRPVVGEQGKLSPIPGPQPNSSPNDITASSSPAFSIPAAVALPRENDSVSPAAQGIPAETAPPADKEDDVSSVSLSPNPPRSETTSIEANSGEPGRITARLQAPPDLTMPNPSESPQPIAVTPIPELPRESATDPVAKIASSDAPPPQNLAAEAKPPEATRPAPHGSPQQNQSAQDAASGRSSTPEPSPSSSGVKPREYTVQEGDTLFDIAQQELGAAKHWPRIYRLNRDRLGDNFGLLPVGLKLAIPTETPAPLTR